MGDYDIEPGVAAAIESFELPEQLGFGPVNAPAMFSVEWREGRWGRGRLLPYGPIEVWPGSRAGITRDSLLVVARGMGYEVHERRMAIDELLAGIRSGSCSELFACGTAAIVSPIAMLADSDGQEYKPRQTNEVARRLRESLLAIQERRAPDPFGWTREVV